MSLIIMPGDPEFNQEVKSETGKLVVHEGTLVGRTMALNLTMRRAWQCGGFAVSTNNPTNIVTNLTVQSSIRQALIEGILIDVTDQASKGLSIDGSRTTRATVEDTGHKVFITVDSKGGMAVIAPDNEESQQKMVNKVDAGDVVIPDNPKIAGVSPAAKFRVQPENVSAALDAFASKFKV